MYVASVCDQILHVCHTHLYQCPAAVTGHSTDWIHSSCCYIGQFENRLALALGYGIHLWFVVHWGSLDFFKAFELIVKSFCGSNSGPSPDLVSSIIICAVTAAPFANILQGCSEMHRLVTTLSECLSTAFKTANHNVECYQPRFNFCNFIMGRETLHCSIRNTRHKSHILSDAQTRS